MFFVFVLFLCSGFYLSSFQLLCTSFFVFCWRLSSSYWRRGWWNFWKDTEKTENFLTFIADFKILDEPYIVNFEDIQKFNYTEYQNLASILIWRRESKFAPNKPQRSWAASQLKQGWQPWSSLRLQFVVYILL